MMTPSSCSLGPVLIQCGVPSSVHDCRFAMSFRRACACCGHENVTCSPDWMVCESHGQNKNRSSTRPMKCSHCLCGPFSVLTTWGAAFNDLTRWLDRACALSRLRLHVGRTEPWFPTTLPPVALYTSVHRVTSSI